MALEDHHNRVRNSDFCDANPDEHAALAQMNLHELVSFDVDASSNDDDAVLTYSYGHSTGTDALCKLCHHHDGNELSLVLHWDLSAEVVVE